MSRDSIDRTALGEWASEQWQDADPHAHPAAGERQTYGEHSLEEYDEQWQRDEQARKERERWQLQWQG